MNEVKIFEVGPRDGLQNETEFIKTEDKVKLISLLVKAGLTNIEATSFVHPKWIPQLADADQVLSSISKQEGVVFSALVPNRRGLERALKANLKEIAVFMSASESFNKKNINKSIEETFPILREVVQNATKEGQRVRGYVSTAFGCPYEGKVPLSQVVRVIDELFKMGIYEVSIGDTTGVANPKQVKDTFVSLIQQYPAERLAGHFHDTWGMGMANVYAALEVGIRKFDSSIGGLGGCPYAPGASGNIATEDLIYLLEGVGCRTGVDQQALTKAGMFMCQKLGRRLPSKVLQAMQAKCGVN